MSLKGLGTGTVVARRDHARINVWPWVVVLGWIQHMWGAQYGPRSLGLARAED